jgi:hypothetical protein
MVACCTESVPKLSGLYLIEMTLLVRCLKKSDLCACVSKGDCATNSALVRRTLSISLVLALCCSMVAPALASSCQHDTSAKMCHRAKHTGSTISAAPDDSKCPMSCCMNAGSRAASPLRSAESSAPLLTAYAVASFESQVFISSGFSSHTDRGPPALLHIAA